MKTLHNSFGLVSITKLFVAMKQSAEKKKSVRFEIIKNFKEFFKI